MAAKPDDANWSELLDSMSHGFSSLTENVLDNLRQLLEQSRKIVGCAEAALLVPAEDPEFLRFLVSVNSKPGIEEIVTQMTIPCDRSIVGCVFSTGQLMAVANPEDFYQEVDQKTGLKTSIYMVTPILDDEEILGVMSFVNRPDENDQRMFDEKEIQASVRLAELAAAGLRYYQRMSMQQQLFDIDISRLTDRLAMGNPSGISFDHEEMELHEQPPLARALVMLERLPKEDQSLAVELINVLQSHANGYGSDLDF